MPKHFSIALWIDYVRGLGSEGVRSEIDSHLARSCPECVAQSARYNLLRETARQTVEAPDTVVARAVAILPVKPPRSWREIVAALTFDSFATPQLAGVRAAAGGTRKLSFSAEPEYRIDLELETRRGNTRVIGQIAGGDIRQVEVRVVASGEVLQTGGANEFGEFETDFAAQEGLSLEIVLSGEKIRIPLPR